MDFWGQWASKCYILYPSRPPHQWGCPVQQRSLILVCLKRTFLSSYTFSKGNCCHHVLNPTPEWGRPTSSPSEKSNVVFFNGHWCHHTFSKGNWCHHVDVNLTPEWGPPSNQQQRSLHRIERERRPHSFGPVFNRGWTAESHEAKPKIGFIGKLRIADSKFVKQDRSFHMTSQSL